MTADEANAEPNEATIRQEPFFTFPRLLIQHLSRLGWFILLGTGWTVVVGTGLGATTGILMIVVIAAASAGAATGLVLGAFYGGLTAACTALFIGPIVYTGAGLYRYLSPGRNLVINRTAKRTFRFATIGTALGAAFGILTGLFVDSKDVAENYIIGVIGGFCLGVVCSVFERSGTRESTDNDGEAAEGGKGTGAERLFPDYLYEPEPVGLSGGTRVALLTTGILFLVGCSALTGGWLGILKALFIHYRLPFSPFGGRDMDTLPQWMAANVLPNAITAGVGAFAAALLLLSISKRTIFAAPRPGRAFENLLMRMMRGAVVGASVGCATDVLLVITGLITPGTATFSLDFTVTGLVIGMAIAWRSETERLRDQHPEATGPESSSTPSPARAGNPDNPIEGEGDRGSRYAARTRRLLTGTVQITVAGAITGAVCGTVFVTVVNLFSREFRGIDGAPLLGAFFGAAIAAVISLPTGLLLHLGMIVLAPHIIDEHPRFRTTLRGIIKASVCGALLGTITDILGTWLHPSFLSISLFAIQPWTILGFVLGAVVGLLYGTGRFGGPTLPAGLSE